MKWRCHGNQYRPTIHCKFMSKNTIFLVLWSFCTLAKILKYHEMTGNIWTRFYITLRKHAYIILTPLNPIFNIVKLGFTGVYINFLISAQNIDCGYSLEPPRRGGSNEYPQSMFLSRNMKNIRGFYLNFFQFLKVKFSTYLHRHVFVMILLG